MPTPNTGETRQAFVSRCMGDAEARKSFSDPKQRAAFCYSQFDNRNKGKSNATEPGAAGPVGPPPSPPNKMSKDMANYRMGVGNYRCESCVNMADDGSCAVVEGGVESGYMCDYYANEQTGSFSQPVRYFMRELLAIQAQTLGTYRVERLSSVDYIVVPVVALVEGVLQGATAPEPELALASEFGRFPTSWNGRPVTIDHPFIQVGQEDAAGKTTIERLRVSASTTPTVMEDFQVGFIFNTHIQDSKLRMEVWLDQGKMLTHSEDSRKLLRSIKQGTQVEVSTGLFAQGEAVSGEYGGKPYSSVWRNIVPDHLALLPEGMTGACSIEDGCGVYANAKYVPSPVLHLKTNLSNSCGCGGQCGCPPADPPGAGTRVATDGSRRTTPPAANAAFSPQNPTPVQPRETLMSGNTAQPGSPAPNAPAAPTPASAAPMTAAQPAAPAQPTAPAVPAQPPLALSATAGAPTPQPAPSPEPKKPQTVEEYLASAPPEIRESLEAGLRMHTARKAQLVAGLKANARNKFTEAQLNAMDVAMLENLTALAYTPDYSGRAPSGDGMRTSATPQVQEGDLAEAPPPPRLGLATNQQKQQQKPAA